jgi:2-oxoglutarate dehydrogenase E1 component
MLMITFGAQEEPKNRDMFHVNEFNLIKWRFSLKACLKHPAPGSYTRAKRRHADAIKMVFDKRFI